MTSAPEQAPARDASAAPTKVDRETVELRAQPARAVRFKRNAVIAIAALGSVSLLATAWVALRPSSLNFARDPAGITVSATAPADALNVLPSSYDTVPKLGPPLPGDLGGPILKRQRPETIDGGDGNGLYAGENAAEKTAEAAELKAARESGLLAQISNRSDPGQSVDVAHPPVAPIAMEDGRLPIDPERDPNPQQRKADLVAARHIGRDISEHSLLPPASPYMLSAGSIIAASLITGLRSDLPGLVIAQVTEQVFDSATGTNLLIPQGARLIGSYDSVVAFGQRRALIIWQRLILPDGSSLRLDNVPGTDTSGYAGLADKVDFHSGSLLKGAVLSTLLGVGAELTISGESDLVQAIRESTQQTASRAGSQVISRNLSVQPSITIRPGASLRLILHRDLILAPWRR